MEDLSKKMPGAKANLLALAAGALIAETAMDAKAAQNLALNAAVSELDARIVAVSNEPHVQMGVLMLAQVLAFRRLMDLHNVKDRGRRHKMLKMALRDFESKLTTYGVRKTEEKVAL